MTSPNTEMEPNMMSKRTVIRVTHVRSQACVQDEKLFIIMILCATISKSTAREPAISSHRHSHIRTWGPTYIRLLKLQTKDRWETHISIWKSRSHRKKKHLLDSCLKPWWQMTLMCQYFSTIMMSLGVSAGHWYCFSCFCSMSMPWRSNYLYQGWNSLIKSINNVWEICQVQGIIRGHDFLQLT